jgi:hypothetical protein
MTYPLFNRFWAVDINDGNEQRTFTGDIEFSISKTNDTTPNECELVLHNLSDDSRKFIDRRNLNVTVSAGYQQGHGVMFRGNIELTDHARALPGWTSSILVHDGGAALRNLTISETIKEGADVTKVIDKILKSLQNVPPGIESQLAEINRLKQETIALASFKPKQDRQPRQARKTNQQGSVPDIQTQQRQYLQKRQQLAAAAEVRKVDKARVLRGSAVAALKTLTDSLGLNLQINDQKISIYPPGVTISDQVINLTPLSGLIGSPRRQDNGYVVQTLLRHELNPGMPIAIESERVTGVFAIARVDHRGNTRSDEWHSEVFCVDIS